MIKTRKISLLKKKVANKKKRNTYKRIKIKKAFRNKKKGGNVIKCGLSSTLGRKSVKVLSKELNEIIKKLNEIIGDKTQNAIEILKKLKDHYKQNSRTLPCECSLIKEGDPNNDEKFSTKNDCEYAKVEYYKNLKSAFFNARNFVLSKYENPQVMSMKTGEEIDKEGEHLQTILDEIEKKITDHDKKIVLVDEIPEPNALEELHKKLMARTTRKRIENKEKYDEINKQDEINAKVMDDEKALDKFDGEKPETKASLHKKETQHLWDQVKTISDTRKKNRR